MKMNAYHRGRSLARRISVVVLTRNRATEVMHSLSRLPCVPEQPGVIVADNASSDDTVARIEAGLPGVRVVQCQSNLGAAGRNQAVACISTDYAAFRDDDTWWEAGSRALAVRLLDASPRVAVLSARVLVGESLELDEQVFVCATARWRAVI